MRQHFLLASGLAATACAGLSPAAVREFAPTFDELRQVNTDLKANHCWVPFQNGRVGMTAGTVPALLVQTDTKTFDPSIVPATGKRIYARAGSEAYNALIVRVEGQSVVLVTDAAIIGDIMLEPSSPIALYHTVTRTPAQTSRLWTNSLTRSQWASMLDCWDEVQHAE
jgi:hypothetical protein